MIPYFRCIPMTHYLKGNLNILVFGILEKVYFKTVLQIKYTYLSLICWKIKLHFELNMSNLSPLESLVRLILQFNLPCIFSYKKDKQKKKKKQKRFNFKGGGLCWLEFGVLLNLNRGLITIFKKFGNHFEKWWFYGKQVFFKGIFQRIFNSSSYWIFAKKIIRKRVL